MSTKKKGISTKVRRTWGSLNPRTRVKPAGKKPKGRGRRDKDAIRKEIRREMDE